MHGKKTRKPKEQAVTPSASSFPNWIPTLLSPVSALLHRLHALLTTLLLAVLALGPIPRHIGFVMDGNRRFARAHGQRVAKGHQQGSESLKRTLQICLRLGIPVVSVYAFAIDNFNRPDEEVNALMNLAQDSLAEICRKGGFLDEHGIRLRCVGRLDLLRPEMQAALTEMEIRTSSNANGVLNVCGPYASRDEITAAVRDVVSHAPVTTSKVTSDKVFASLELVQSAAAVCNGEANSGKLDILVRTSDVKRLSDFMTWQASSGTQVHFVKTYWPDFGLTDMLPILLGWQQKQWLLQGADEIE